MKKLLAGLVVLGGIALYVGSAQAALTADLTITVTPAGTKSIAIAGSPYDFGSLNVGVSSVSATAVVIENDGTLPMQVGAQVTTQGAPWTVGAAPGDDIYNLRALFNTTRPADGDFTAVTDDLTTGLTLATAAVYAGDESGLNVAPAAAVDNRNLWLRIDMPTSTSVSTQRSIVVQLSAN